MKSKKSLFFLIVLSIICSFFLFSIGYCKDLKTESRIWEELKRSVEETWTRNVMEIEKELDKVDDQQKISFRDTRSLSCQVRISTDYSGPKHLKRPMTI